MSPGRSRGDYHYAQLLNSGFIALVGLMAGMGVDSAIAQTLSSTTISVTVKGKQSTHTIYCSSSTPGNLKHSKFVSFAAQIRRAKELGKTSKLPLLKALKRAGITECAGISDTPATPSPGTGNFDASGNLTATGKTRFGVPSNLNGNISVGRAYFTANCGCHGEKLNQTFPMLRLRISQAPMYFDSTQVPDSDLANLVAFFNRFQL